MLPGAEHGTQGAKSRGMATKKSGLKQVKVTVGDLIAAVFDVVGDQVDQVVDVLRFDDMKRRSLVEIEGALTPRKGAN